MTPTTNKENSAEFLRTSKTRGRKPKLPSTPEVERKRRIRRESFHRRKNAPENLAKKLAKKAKNNYFTEQQQQQKETQVKQQDIAPSLVSDVTSKPSELQQPKATMAADFLRKLTPSELSLFDFPSQDSTNFRLSARRVFLTYSKIPKDITLQVFFENLKENLQLKDAEIIVSQENSNNSSSNNNHFHALAIAPKKLNIRNTRLLDVIIDNKLYHGSYKAGSRNISKLVTYIKKQNNYLSTNDQLFDNIEGDKPNEITELVSKGEFTADQALKYLEDDPKRAVGRISTAFKGYEESKKIKQLQTDRAVVPTSNLKLENFNISSSIKKWCELPTIIKPVLVLVGESGIGKTLFVKSLASTYRWKTLHVNSRESLRRLTIDHDLIVFEDYPFVEKDEQLLAFFINDEGSKIDLRILYGAVTRHNHQMMIITLNPGVFQSHLAQFFKEKRFSRRTQIEFIEDDFLKEEAKLKGIFMNGALVLFPLDKLEKDRINHNKEQLCYAVIKKKGGNPAAPSSTATLLRLHPGH